MPTSCLLYEIETSVDLSAVKSRAENNYSNTRNHNSSGNTLETDLLNIDDTSRGFSCTLRYDYAAKRGARPGMSQWYIDVKQTPVRFTPDHFIIIGSKHTGRELSEIRELLKISESDYTPFSITQGVIASAAGQDAQREEQGSWEGIDNDTDTGIIYGDVDQSSYAADFDNAGNVTYLKYESQNYPGSVGLSANQNSVVFWTNSWDRDEMEDYIYDVLI
ncbi:hypothetical protein NP511_09245 [Natrinema thermotolerans]|uniref:Uncharacterized protein n=1 Tax=Natrinema thermotolerans TaxID=121872 RepID=A0AAF0T3V4_9EURY|nr:hypothetical protein [Natrinema thermotolerans]WMT09797.1 hypothetical protein NP511_09245 [Natrinema thermotolerans]